jgi:large subunit ribosomal protein L25
MARTSLNAQLREGTGKSVTRKLRAEGRIPAVVYGRKEATRSLTVDAHELERLFSQVHYENTVLTLNIEGERGEVRALVREVQKHAYRAEILHVDFHQVHAGEKIHVGVPLRLVGAAPGVKAGGVLQHTLTELQIECSADSIPDHIDVDVSGLEIGDTVHVRDLALPAGATMLGDEDRSVCSLSPPTVSAVEDEAVEPSVEDEEPEVIGRGRDEDEDEDEDKAE